MAEVQQYSKILVINLMHVGDLLLVTPVLRTLRTNFPQANISLLADKKLEDLVKYNQNIDELIAIDKKGYHNTILHYLAFIGAIRRCKFDLVINLHANERASAIAAFSGGGRIIGYSSWGLGVFFDFVMKNRKKIKHQVQSHFDVLKEGLGISRIDDRGIELWLDDEAEAAADSLWQTKFTQPSLSVVGLNIGASWPTKRWPKEYFAELADALLERGYGVAYFGGTMDLELVQQTLNLMKYKDHQNLAVFTGKMTLLELAAMLKKCAALVTNDSGPMHVAVAMKVPLVSMFGASPVMGFSPYNETSVILKSPIACHPCYSHECKIGLQCMKDIPVQLVLQKTLELMKKCDSSR